MAPFLPAKFLFDFADNAPSEPAYAKQVDAAANVDNGQLTENDLQQQTRACQNQRALRAKLVGLYVLRFLYLVFCAPFLIVYFVVVVWICGGLLGCFFSPVVSFARLVCHKPDDAWYDPKDLIYDMHTRLGLFKINNVLPLPPCLLSATESVESAMLTAIDSVKSSPEQAFQPV